jgi:SAM-dependent methyltransferase
MPDPRDEMTERILRDAGIGAGMRVLDFGCGSGNVSFMLRKLVGERGKVLGIDRDDAPLALARNKAAEFGFSNVEFERVDLSSLSAAITGFDAVAGRRVLMYLPDPVDSLKRLGGCLRPGGRIVFQEHDATMVPGRVSPMPLHERVHDWIWNTVRREGGNAHIGFDLPGFLAESGFSLEHIRAEAVIQTPDTPYPLAQIVRAMLHRIVERGVARAEEIDMETLESRLDAERAQVRAIYISDMVFSGWGRKPL